MTEMPENRPIFSFLPNALRQYGLNRGRFLQVGGTGLFGLSWSVMHKAEALATQAKTERKARQLVILWCNGGLGHLDCFDPKSDTPDTVRSPWPVVQTKVPGMILGERVGSLARVADKITLLRSCNAKGYPQEGQHGMPPASAFLTGTRRDTRERQPNSPQSPLFGNAMAYFRFGPGDVPPNVILGSGRGHDSFLGPAFDPMEIKVNDPSDKLKQMLAPPPDLLELDTLQRRTSLLESVNEQLRKLDAADELIGGLDEFKQKAFDLLRSPKLRQAVDLSRENVKTAQRYGRVDTGQRVLTARRLIEAGVPCGRYSRRLGLARRHQPRPRCWRSESPRRFRRGADRGPRRPRPPEHYHRHDRQRDGPHAQAQSPWLWPGALERCPVVPAGGRRPGRRHRDRQHRQDWRLCHQSALQGYEPGPHHLRPARYRSRPRALHARPPAGEDRPRRCADHQGSPGVMDGSARPNSDSRDRLALRAEENQVLDALADVRSVHRSSRSAAPGGRAGSVAGRCVSGRELGPQAAPSQVGTPRRGSTQTCRINHPAKIATSMRMSIICRLSLPWLWARLCGA
jgi:hypothetical protein